MLLGWMHKAARLFPQCHRKGTISGTGRTGRRTIAIGCGNVLRLYTQRAKSVDSIKAAIGVNVRFVRPELDDPMKHPKAVRRAVAQQQQAVEQAFHDHNERIRPLLPASPTAASSRLIKCGPASASLFPFAFGKAARARRGRPSAGKPRTVRGPRRLWTFPCAPAPPLPRTTGACWPAA